MARMWNAKLQATRTAREAFWDTTPASFLAFWDKWDRKNVILKNKAEKLLKTKGKATWIAKNKPENKAEKLLKIRACGKNKPERTGKRTGPCC